MARQSKYTHEILSQVVATSRSTGEVLDALGLRRTGGNYRHIAQRIEACSIDRSHVNGKGWSKGLAQETLRAVARSANFNRTPDAEVFRRGSTYRLSKLQVN